MVEEWGTRELQNRLLYSAAQQWCNISYLTLVVLYIAVAAYILTLPGAWMSRTRQGAAQSGVLAALGMAPLLLVFVATLNATAITRLVPVEGASVGGPAALALDNPLAVLGGCLSALIVAALPQRKVWPVSKQEVDDRLLAKYPGRVMTRRDVKRVLRKENAAELGSTAHHVGLALAVGTLVGSGLEHGFTALASRGDSQFVEDIRSILFSGTARFFAALAAVLVGFLWRSIRSSNTRKSASLIWDVVMFWPRAVHPWGVPWAGRRAVLEVSKRLAHLTEDGDLVLWAHSQGTVLAVAALGTMTPEQRGRIALITCGSPLRMLYSQHFPAYWNPETTRALAHDLKSWDNYFRATDYVGRSVAFESQQPTDLVLDDPSLTDAEDGWRTPRAHSDYWTDPVIRERVRQLMTPH